MVSGYAIQYPAVLVSRHTQRRAVDMTISWHGTLDVKDASGQTHAIAHINTLILSCLCFASAVLGTCHHSEWQAQSEFQLPIIRDYINSLSPVVSYLTCWLTKA